MCPMLLMTKAVKTKRRDIMGKGVAVLTISRVRTREERKMSRRRVSYKGISCLLGNTQQNTAHGRSSGAQWGGSSEGF